MFCQPKTPSEFFDRLDICIENALDLSSVLLLLGDINEDQRNLSNNKLRNELLLNSMSNFTNKPKRVTHYWRTLIDPIAITNNIQYVQSGVFETERLDKLNDKIRNTDWFFYKSRRH